MSGRGPESLRQARRFDELARFYRDTGLCVVCAAQAAFGRQQGWATVRSPCATCTEVLRAGFAAPVGASWRLEDARKAEEGTAEPSASSAGGGGDRPGSDVGSGRRVRLVSA